MIFQFDNSQFKIVFFKQKPYTFIRRFKLRFKRVAIVLFLVSVAYYTMCGVNEWTKKGEWNGDVRALEMSPHKKGEIIAGLMIQHKHFYSGKIALSKDSGQTWSIQRFEPAIISLTFDPKDKDTIWAGTMYCCLLFPAPIYKSIDGGKTWNETNISDEWLALNIFFDPGDPNTMYIESYRHKIYKSIDNGNTWTQFLDGYYGLWIDPENNSVLYSNVHNEGTGYFNAVKSMDGGVSWEEIGVEDDILFCSTDPLNSGVVWGRSQESGCLYKSSDFGSNWSLMHCPEDGGIFIGPWIDPTNSNNMYGFHGYNVNNDNASYKICRSKDGGLNWQIFNKGLRDDAYGDIAIDPFCPERLYLGTEKGLYAIRQTILNIHSISLLSDPFRLKVSGSGFQNGIKVFIGEETDPWEQVEWKNDGKIIIKGGNILKNKVPKGVETTFTFINPDGGKISYKYIR